MCYLKLVVFLLLFQPVRYWEVIPTRNIQSGLYIHVRQWEVSAINVCYWEVFPLGVYGSSFRTSTFWSIIWRCPLFGMSANWRFNYCKEKCQAANSKFIKTKKQKKNKKILFIVHHEDLLNRFVTLFISIKHISLTVMTCIEYIYTYIEYIKTKSNSKNCQVENNMEIIFPMEKYVTPPRTGRKHQHQKLSSVKSNLNNSEGVLAFFGLGFQSFCSQLGKISISASFWKD